MKTLKHSYIQNTIKACLSLNKEEKFISLYSKQISGDEFFLNININKDLFKSKIGNNISIDTDLLFVFHLTHNFPINPPRLFCLTSLSHLGIEICDAKDILEDVLGKEWESQIRPKEIILSIPKFIQQCLENKNNKLFVGKYILEYEYDYNMLSKIPNHYFNFVEEIINKKTGKKEKRLLMITSLFFLVFEYKVGYFNYNEVKLIFWASIKSIYGMKNDNNNFEFEFSKNFNDRIYLHLITNEGGKIVNIVLYILKERGIDYKINKESDSNELPGIDNSNNEDDKKNENVNNGNLNGINSNDENIKKNEEELKEKKEGENNKLKD